MKITFCQDSGRGLVKAPPDFSRLPLTSELPLKLPLHCYGFRSAAAAGEYIQLHSVELVLTAMQRILPLAGLTAGLALIPRTAAYAEEPPLDPIRSIVKPYTLYCTILPTNRLPANPQTNLLNPQPRTLHPRHRSNNTPTSLRHNLHPLLQRQHPKETHPNRPPRNPSAQNPPPRPQLRRPRRRRPKHQSRPLHERRTHLHLDDSLPRPAQRIQRETPAGRDLRPGRSNGGVDSEPE